MRFDYKEFVRRNSPLLTPDDQDKIRKTRLLIAGCGQGSVTAETAVRIGFEKLVLVDGDTVELTNMNRQAYDLEDVGHLKVEALSKRLKRINPDCNLTLVPHFLKADNVSDIVSKVDIVVDFIDVLSFEDIFSLHREVLKQRKCIVAPFGAGWGAAVIIFSPDSVNLGEMIQSRIGVRADQVSGANILEVLQRFLIGLPAIPCYVSNSLADLMIPGATQETVAACCAPSIAALAASELTIAATIRLVLGLPTRIAPEVIHFDPWLALDPSN